MRYCSSYRWSQWAPYITCLHYKELLSPWYDSSPSIKLYFTVLWLLIIKQTNVLGMACLSIINFYFITFWLNNSLSTIKSPLETFPFGLKFLYLVSCVLLFPFKYSGTFVFKWIALSYYEHIGIKWPRRVIPEVNESNISWHSITFIFHLQIGPLPVLNALKFTIYSLSNICLKHGGDSSGCASTLCCKTYCNWIQEYNVNSINPDLYALVYRVNE